MDGSQDDVELLLASVAHEVGAIRTDPRLSKVEGSRGEALRTHIVDLLDAVEFRASQPPPATAPMLVRQAFARNLRQSIIVLRGSHAALPWLDATRSPAVNLGSLYLAEECAEILIGRDVDLVVVPDPEFMYSTTSWPFDRVIRATRGFVQSTTRRPVVLNFPMTDSDRTLLHSIFAHELGHASVDEHGLVHAIESGLNADPGFTAGLQQTVLSLLGVWPGSEAQITGGVQIRLRNWIEELLCDNLAAAVMGPSYLWAVAVFLMPLSYGEPSDSHPPNTLRLRLLLDQLARQGWRPYMERVAPSITRWVTDVSADTQNQLPPPFSFLRDQLLAHAQMIDSAAPSAVSARTLQPIDAIREADEAAELLRRFVMPVGLNQILSPRCILLGGWQQAIAAHGDTPTGLVAALEDVALQELVGKALEMSTVATAWTAQP